MVPYRPRHLLTALRHYLAQFSVVLLQGSRQVGKSTMLRTELRDWTLYDLEDEGTRDLVALDPGLFLREHPDKIWFDEAQRVPELFSAMRVAVDRDRRPGRYLLSGSATPQLIEAVSESLAGRAGLLDLMPFSLAEASTRPPSPLLEILLRANSPEAFMAAMADHVPCDDETLTRLWFRGGFPEPYLLEDEAAWSRWFGSYIRLVAERDLFRIDSRLRPNTILRLFRMLAARHGSALNLQQLARDMALSRREIERYLDIAEGVYLWRRLPPFVTNLGKRIVKTPRAYLVDSGMLHAFLSIRNYDELLVHPLMGSSFESFVIQQFFAAATLLDQRPEFLFHRTHNGLEVDLVIEQGIDLWLVEIKHTSRLRSASLRGLRQLVKDLGDRVRLALVIYRGETIERIGDKLVALPVGYLG